MSDDDDGQHEGCGGRSDEVEGEASRANDVDDGQQRAGHEHRSQDEQRDEADPAQGFARISRARFALLQGPVAELGRCQQPGGDEGRGAVERSVVHRELGGVQASEQEERDGKQHRPVQNQGRNERKQRENRDAETDLDQSVVLGTCERHSRQRGRAGDGSDACGYARATLA